MFSQGDKEKERNLLVSPLFDRDKPGVSKSQVGFYEVCGPAAMVDISRDAHA